MLILEGILKVEVRIENGFDTNRRIKRLKEATIPA